MKAFTHSFCGLIFLFNLLKVAFADSTTFTLVLDADDTDLEGQSVYIGSDSKWYVNNSTETVQATILSNGSLSIGGQASGIGKTMYWMSVYPISKNYIIAEPWSIEDGYLKLYGEDFHCVSSGKDDGSHVVGSYQAASGRSDMIAVKIQAVDSTGEIIESYTPTDYSSSDVSSSTVASSSTSSASSTTAWAATATADSGDSVPFIMVLDAEGTELDGQNVFIGSDSKWYVNNVTDTAEVTLLANSSLEYEGQSSGIGKTMYWMSVYPISKNYIIASPWTIEEGYLKLYGGDFHCVTSGKDDGSHVVGSYQAASGRSDMIEVKIKAVDLNGDLIENFTGTATSSTIASSSSAISSSSDSSSASTTTPWAATATADSGDSVPFIMVLDAEGTELDGQNVFIGSDSKWYVNNVTDTAEVTLLANSSLEYEGQSSGLGKTMYWMSVYPITKNYIIAYPWTIEEGYLKLYGQDFHCVSSGKDDGSHVVGSYQGAAGRSDMIVVKIKAVDLDGDLIENFTGTATSSSVISSSSSVSSSSVQSSAESSSAETSSSSSGLPSSSSLSSSLSADSSLSSSSSSESSISTKQPELNGSLVNGEPKWELSIPGSVGTWSGISLEVSNNGSSGLFNYDSPAVTVNGESKTDFTSAVTSSGFSFSLDFSISEDDELIISFGGSIVSGSEFTSSASLIISLTESKRIVKRQELTYSFESTITSDGSSSESVSSTVVESTSSIASSSHSSSSVINSTSDVESSSRASSSVIDLSSSLESSSISSSTGASDNLITSTSTQDNESTTVITITSCDENKCTEEPVTTGVTVVTETSNGTVTSYTTYCPLTTETTTKDNQSTTVVTVTSCSNDVCTTRGVTTGFTVVTETSSGVVTSYTTYCPLTTETTTEGNQSTTVVTVTSCSNEVCTSTGVTTGVTVVTETSGSVVSTHTTYCPLTTETNSIKATTAETGSTETKPTATDSTEAGSTKATQTEEGSTKSPSTENNISTNGNISVVTSTVTSCSASSCTESTTTFSTNFTVLTSTVAPTSTGNNPTVESASASSTNSSPSTNTVLTYEGSGNKLIGSSGLLSVVALLFLI